MKFLILKSTDPYLNLAIEEYLFKNETDDIFMLWQNEPTIVIGRNQNAYAEINREYTEKNGIHIARRITGGGAVYHDLGNINYSYISTRAQKKDIDFAYFTAPIIAALNSFGVNAKLTGRNDLEAEGRKFSGNAQHKEGNRILHHGTILFDTDLNILNEALKVDEEKIKAKAIRSTRARVVNLKELLKINITLNDFLNILSSYIIKEYSPQIAEIPISKEITDLKEKYESFDWIYPKKVFLSNYTITKKRRYDFGTVNIELYMSNEIIIDVRISGDFFGHENIENLENIIRNKSLSEIEKALSHISIEKYIYGADSRLIIEQITL